MLSAAAPRHRPPQPIMPILTTSAPAAWAPRAIESPLGGRGAGRRGLEEVSAWFRMVAWVFSGCHDVFSLRLLRVLSLIPVSRNSG